MTTENKIVALILLAFVGLFTAALLMVWNETPAERCTRLGGTYLKYLQACDYQGDIQRDK
jgi:hypothetical protein